MTDRDTVPPLTSSLDTAPFAANPELRHRIRATTASSMNSSTVADTQSQGSNRSGGNNNNNNNNSGAISNRSNHSEGVSRSGKKKKRKKKRWRWIVRTPKDLTPEQEQVFMTMKLRKLNRALTGTKTKRTRFDVFILLAYFVLAVGVVSYGNEANQNTDGANGNQQPVIQLQLIDIVVILIYVFVVTLVTSVFRESKWITLIYWMVIYLPLCAMIINFVVGEDDTLVNSVVAVMLLTSEMVVLVVFLTLYKIYPKVVMSSWFRRKSRAGIFWRIKVVSDWTMTYVGSWGRRFTCKYDGETNDQGLPHGFGRWLDDADSGEVLTGTWINGFPIAPFASRHYGTGDAFKAVRVGYIMASDDEYTTTKFWPSNDKPPRIGLTSVECSISGSFYNELPLATHLSGPHWLNEQSHSVARLCAQLTHIDDEEERVHQIVQIKASDPRGVQVRGHVYGPTGETFHAGSETVVVMVDKDFPEGQEGDEQAPANGENRPRLTPRRSLNFMPRASRQSFRPERIIVCDDESESNEEDSDTVNNNKNLELTTVEEEDSARDSMNLRENSTRNPAPFSTGNGYADELYEFSSAHSREGEESGISEPSAQFDPPPPATPPNAYRAPLNHSTHSSSSAFPFGYSGGSSHDIEMSIGASERDLFEEQRRLEPFRLVNASLRIKDWIPAPHKDALIFFPGYKVPLKNALEALGQFIAMTRLDSRIYPIIFGWPCGQRWSYHAASQLSATQKNRDTLLRLVQGLRAGGVRNVHFMTHSMGVQTLLGAFSNKDDGSPSDVAECFQLDPDFVDDQDMSSHNTGGGNDQKMICRTITMLNPDFPLEAFVDRSFQSVRRVCSTVTIIGDRHDKALFMSQLMNGIAVYCGYKQPEVLQPKPTRERLNLSKREVYQGKHRFLQQVIGLSIESLFFPKDIDRDGLNDAFLFKERAPVIICNDADDEEQVRDRAWLDLDVIDTTGLDTNIAGIRHSGFNLNPILLKDLEELLATGRRAISRATLLYREGNLFSYCHAPSYVAM